MASAAALRDADPPLLLSPFVLSELDHFLTTRRGVGPEMALLSQVATAAYQLESFDRDDVARALAIVKRYADLGIGLADASIVVLADRYDISDVLTLDVRHFGTVRRSNGRPFRLLPT